MRNSLSYSVLILWLAGAVACSSQEVRGIADKRTDFSKFLPMTSDPARDGLKAVNPYFRKANRSEIMAAIERACDGRRSGSSVFEERKSAGYYVNCNVRNRQLLNGYVPINPKVEPRSR